MRLLVSILCLLVSVTAGASGSDSNQTIQAKANQCVGCHEIPGYRSVYPEVYPVPRIIGQSAAYIELALKAYRENQRLHPSMNAIASQLSDTDIKELAEYYQSKGEKTSEALSTPVVSGNPLRGETLSNTCATCHGADGNNIMANYPVLAGQYEEYLYKSLRSYKNGDRQGQLVMSGQLAVLSNVDSDSLVERLQGIDDQDLADLSAYYASQKGLLR